MSRSTFTVTALVLKRSSVGEKDRLVTLLSQEHGKFYVIAKGARSLSSSRLGLLEPGALIQAHCVERPSWPILTQVVAIDHNHTEFDSLIQIKALSQLLEILDQLFVEEKIESGVYQRVLTLRSLVISRPQARTAIQKQLLQLLAQLGFIDINQKLDSSISQFVSNLTNKKLVSFKYLTVNPRIGVK